MTDRPSADAPSRAEEFEEHRARLLAIAYRILGSVADAEDVVQETWLRWEASATRPRSTRAFLATITTRLAVDVLRSARARREIYPGPWFPEPLVSDPYTDPERSAELADSVSMAAMLLLERLSPLERAVFVLREVFGYPYAEVAATVERSEDACRQLCARARAHMAQERPRFAVDRAEADGLTATFIAALRAGDVDRLREVLTADAVLVADAGGKAPLFGDGVFVGDRLIRLLVGMAPDALAAGVTLTPERINGGPGAILHSADGHVLGTWALEVRDGQLQTIRAVLNPDKLRHLGPLADPWQTLQDTKDARAAARRQR